MGKGEGGGGRKEKGVLGKEKKKIDMGKGGGEERKEV